MKLRKTLTGVKGYEQLDLGESPARSSRRSAERSSLEPLPRLGGDQHGLGMAQRELSALLLVEQIDLVHHQQPRRGAGADLLEHRVRGRDRVRPLLLGLGAVDDVQDQVGEDRLLERRLEGLDERVRKLADEADGVREQDSGGPRA